MTPMDAHTLKASLDMITLNRAKTAGASAIISDDGCDIYITYPTYK